MIYRNALGVFLISWVLCLATMGGHLYSPDEEIMFRVTESIATRARLDVEPIVGPDGSTFATRKGTNGREYAQYGVGNSLAGVPLYWLGQLACVVVSDSAARDALDFQTQNYVKIEGPGRGHALLKRFFVSLTGGIIGSLTAVAIFLFCRRLAAPRGADAPAWSPAACGLTALAYIGGTMALPHARTFFSEPLAGLCLLMCFSLLAAPAGKLLTLKRAAAAGAMLALGFFTRLDTLFAAPGIGLLLLVRLPGPSLSQGSGGIGGSIAWLRQRLRGPNALVVAGFVAPCLLFVAWQLAINAMHFGSPFASAYADQAEGINFSTPVLAGLYGFTMSIGKSIFLFSPAILLGLLGWRNFGMQHRALAVCLAVSIIGKVLVHSTWQNWAGGWCWGPRHIFIVHALLMVPAVGFFASMSLGKRLLADALLVAAFIVQVYGASQNFIDYYALYFRTPYTPPQATVMYGGEDIAAGYIRAEAAGPDGSIVPLPLNSLPAPIVDSIYMPQNSQWYRYADMWNAGYTDNVWLRWLQRARGKEQPIQ